MRRSVRAAAALSAALLAGTAQAQAQAQNDARIIALINAMRAAPGQCGASRAAPVPPLANHPLLARVRIGVGVFPEYALEQVGYQAAEVEVISARGPQDAVGVMELIRQPYCRVLLNPAYSDIGATRAGKDEGSEWTIVLARPLLRLELPPLDVVGREILEAVNAARAVPRSCGEQAFGAAPPVAWNQALGAAALAHSRDMAARRHFGHEGSDGSMVAARATRAGYSWRVVGENIAAGQTSAAEAVAGWIESPGHCANLMNPVFTEMGAGYEISRARLPGFAYWTQVFALPR